MDDQSWGWLAYDLVRGHFGLYDWLRKYLDTTVAVAALAAADLSLVALLLIVARFLLA
jgi:hypothetical protein